MDTTTPPSIPPECKTEVDMILIMTAQLCDFQDSAMPVWRHSRCTLKEESNNSKGKATSVFKVDFDVPLLH